VNLAQKILTSIDIDPTKGAHYYANLKNIDKGGWFERVISGPNGAGTPEHPLLTVIGHHTFYL
jgi:hypothetical protein